MLNKSINYIKLESLYHVFNDMKDNKMPFKLGLIVAKNLEVLEREREFYMNKEQEFAFKYLEFNQETNMFVETAPGSYKIKSGLEKECGEAREALDNFEVEVNLHTFPQSLLEFSNVEFTPAQLMELEELIEEE